MISRDLDEAEKILLSDGIVAIPTETVYGLSASIESDTALRKIFEIKERPFFDPLIVHIYDLKQLKRVVSSWSVEAEALAEEFWPGPLTIIAPKSQELNPLITAGLDTVGVRMPLHPVTRKLLHLIGIPLAAPSANKFGKVSPTTANHVQHEFGEELFILDGGPSQFGLESTVVRVSSDVVEILRPGMITEEMIREFFAREGRKMQVIRSISQASPGHLDQHYQPKVPLFIIESDSEKDKIEKNLKLKSPRWRELKLSSNPQLVARTLYADLRELSDSDADYIFVKKDAQHSGGAWSAIWDRLGRAASSLEKFS